MALALWACQASVAEGKVVAPAGPVDLVVCVLQGADDDDTAELAKTFLAQVSEKSYFTSLVAAKSPDDAQNCNVSVRLTCANPAAQYGKCDGLMTVFSTHSKRAFFMERWKGRVSEVVDGLATDMHRFFQNDPALVRRVAAETVPAQAQEGARTSPAAEVVAAPAPKAAQASDDVDQPKVQLAKHPDDYAVVVGIEKYSNDLPDAQFAEHDAVAVKNHLLALGYPERNIKFLTGPRATGTSLASYIEEWLPRNVKADSRVFFYFSGHGAPSEFGRAFLVPWDGNPNFLEKSAYPLKKLYSQLGNLKAKQVIVVLDSCFSGAGGRSVLAEGARPLVTKVDTSVAQNSKIVLFAAASSKEMTTTLKDQGHGIFTYYFLKGLGGAAKREDGVLTARGLYDYLKPEVQDAAAHQNREQTPVLEGATGGEIAHF